MYVTIELTSSMESEGSACMAWPAYSFDLNSIGNHWEAVGRAVSSRFPPSIALLSCKLLYKKNGDCLILRWLTTYLKA
ncbi:hypothetical protein TNCV_3622331 [Trichonephila clavipes]|nr:hypothetical protein TNCV_3622331 [Trichonephila clavipes]